MKHHAIMLWSLFIFSSPVLANSDHLPGLLQASWEIFIYDFGSKAPQPPTNTDKKPARQTGRSVHRPVLRPPPMMPAPTNGAKKGDTFSRT
ncbi:virulence factor [Salmonella enterica]|nr:virulence factor [Salmonella enterica subsp. arizonae]EHN2304447.1 virulence factor [Salmonella enterica]